MEDTICAISTALGVGAISIVRVSGDNSIELVNKLFKGKDLTSVDSHTINYGFIIDNEEVIDEVLVSIMKAPRTYTKEDLVRIMELEVADWYADNLKYFTAEDLAYLK